MTPTPPGELWLLDHAPIHGGAEAFALRLAEHARDAHGRTVRLLCPGDSELAQRAVAAALPVLDVPFGGSPPAGLAATALGVGRLAQLFGRAPAGTTVVANTALSQAAAIGAAALMPGPAVVHLLHEQDTARRPSARALLPRHGALAAVGENVAATYRDLLGGAGVTALNNFLSRPELERLAARTAPDRRPMGGTLGVLARLIPEKGVMELVEELATVPSAWSRLLVGGPEQDRDHARAVRDRAAALGLGERVTFLGPVSDADGFFDELDALVVPSTGSEGQPTVIIEALAQRCPVIVRRPLWSPDFADLPVGSYSTAGELGAWLQAPPAAPAEPDVLAERFGPDQALRALDAAARDPGARGRPRLAPSGHNDGTAGDAGRDPGIGSVPALDPERERGSASAAVLAAADTVARRLLGPRYLEARVRHLRHLALRDWRHSPAAGPTERFVDSHGLEVSGGPLAGLRYAPEMVGAIDALAAKLTGAYEHELHPAVERVLADGFDTMVDIGTAEGYYAVGMALASPGSRVHGFDTSFSARLLCERLAEVNGVSDRVSVHGEFDPRRLHELAGERLFVLCDCEGCEIAVLDPELSPPLREATILVELHDFIDDSITPTLLERFAATHDAVLIDAAGHGGEAAGHAPGLSESARAVLLDEGRPPGMRWGLFTPR